jgi:hypothetical protein
VKVEHTPERLVTPPACVLSAGRWPSKAAGSRAPVTRLGVELPLCRSPRPDQASARGPEACSDRGGYPRRARSKPGNPERLEACSVPRGPPPTRRANGEVFERARVPSRRRKPRFPAALVRLQRSRTEATFFARTTAQP